MCCNSFTKGGGMADLKTKKCIISFILFFGIPNKKYFLIQLFIYYKYTNKKMKIFLSFFLQIVLVVYIKAGKFTYKIIALLFFEN